MRVRIIVTHEGQRFVGEVELYPANEEAPSGQGCEMASEDSREVARKPSEAVNLAYRRGFFREARTLSEVRDGLRQDGYSFSPQSILMALQAARFLRRTGMRGSYRFVQKFPPAA